MAEPKKCGNCGKEGGFVPIATADNEYVCLHCQHVQKGD